MSQNDYTIANQSAPDFRSDLNDALQALASLSSGSSAPSTTYANMLWYDTGNNILKMRTEADDAWINIGTLDQSTNTFAVAGSTGAVKAWVNFDGTGTVAIRASFNVSSITDNGTGDYTINFTDDIEDANYAPQITVVGNEGIGALRNGVVASDGSSNAALKSVSQLRIHVGVPFTNTFIDLSEINVSVMR
jgi:hypothetical protein